MLTAIFVPYQYFGKQFFPAGLKSLKELRSHISCVPDPTQYNVRSAEETKQTIRALVT